jgi:hypothetical protein
VRRQERPLLSRSTYPVPIQTSFSLPDPGIELGVGPVKKTSKRTALSVLMALALLLGASQLMTTRATTAAFTETELKNELNAGRVRSVNFIRGAGEVTGELNTEIANGKFRGAKKFTAKYDEASEEALVNIAEAKNVIVEASAKKDPIWVSILFNVLPIIVLGLFLGLIIALVTLFVRSIVWWIGKIRRPLQVVDDGADNHVVNPE